MSFAPYSRVGQETKNYFEKSIETRRKNTSSLTITGILLYLCNELRLFIWLFFCFSPAYYHVCVFPYGDGITECPFLEWWGGGCKCGVMMQCCEDRREKRLSLSLTPHSSLSHNTLLIHYVVRVTFLPRGGRGGNVVTADCCRRRRYRYTCDDEPRWGNACVFLPQTNVSCVYYEPPSAGRFAWYQLLLLLLLERDNISEEVEKLYYDWNARGFVEQQRKRLRLGGLGRERNVFFLLYRLVDAICVFFFFCKCARTQTTISPYRVNKI